MTDISVMKAVLIGVYYRINMEERGSGKYIPSNKNIVYKLTVLSIDNAPL